MDPYGNPNRLAINSTYGGGESCSKQTGTETLNDQTYFVNEFNLSCNHNDCAGYFEMPEYVTDMYLQALDGGDESNAALRQISGVYGPKPDQEEFDINFNHNVNPEPCPNEGCGCTGSYNGGAGGGTAECSSCCCEKPYEPGFADKKRDPACCCCQDDTYQKGLVNKKPCTEWTTEYKYTPELPPPPPYCAASDATCCGTSPCCPAKCNPSPCCPLPPPCCPSPPKPDCVCETYQRELCNKKPECTVEYKYVPQLPPPEPYCTAKDKSCCSTGCAPGPDTYELIRNTDAQRYNGKGPDRSNFYADESCGCQYKSNGSCNNNYEIVCMNRELDWTEMRKSAYSVLPSKCPCNSPCTRRRSCYSVVDDFSANDREYKRKRTSGVRVNNPTSFSSSFHQHSPLNLSRSSSPDRPAVMEVRRPISFSSDENTKEDEFENGQSSGRCILQ